MTISNVRNAITEVIPVSIEAKAATTEIRAAFPEGEKVSSDGFDSDISEDDEGTDFDDESDSKAKLAKEDREISGTASNLLDERDMGTGGSRDEREDGSVSLP
ncbi:hypothetical protein U1Q18_040523 [Sarracenia purpurea var. burkii]